MGSEMCIRDSFGGSAIDGDTVVVGAYGDDDACTDDVSSDACNSGAAYVFDANAPTSQPTTSQPTSQPTTSQPTPRPSPRPRQTPSSDGAFESDAATRAGPLLALLAAAATALAL